MLLPDGLSSHLGKYAAVKDEKVLLELLKKHHSDAVEFFVAACDDETWCERFPGMITNLIRWMTEELLMGDMDRNLAQRAARKIQSHYFVLQPDIAPNLICHLHDKSHAINSFQFQALSLPFFYLIRKECRDKKQHMLEIKALTLKEFEVLEEFIHTGDSLILWQVPVAEVPKILKLALKWGLPELASKCERIFLRDLTDDNVFDMLAMSFSFPLEKLKAGCLDLINTWISGVHVSIRDGRHFSCELTEATEVSLSLFNKLTPYLTEWVCGSHVIEDPDAMAVAAIAPRLTALDLVKTRQFNADLLKQIAPKIRELNLAGCAWLTDASFKQIVQLFPLLESLNLGSTVQLSAAAWAELVKLRTLRALFLSRCSNLSDADLQLILNAGRNLEELDLSECHQISDHGFHILATSKRPLSYLNLGRSQLSDTTLLELAFKLPTLTKLDLTRCQDISEEAILEAIRLATALRSINLAQTSISEPALQELRQNRPILEVISE